MKIIIEIILKIVPLIRKFLKERNLVLESEIKELEDRKIKLNEELFLLEVDLKSLDLVREKKEEKLNLIHQHYKEMEWQLSKLKEELKEKLNEIKKMSDDDLFDTVNSGN